MKLSRLIELMGPSSWTLRLHTQAHLPRYAAMCGFYDIPAMNDADKRIYGADKIEVPDEIVPTILALYFAERATDDLRTMGEGIGKVSIKIPSNINVWQHLKGEAPLLRAAQSLTEAAKMIAERATQ